MEPSELSSSATLVGLVFAGLGAVLAYTQLGPLLGQDTHTHTRATDADADVDAGKEEGGSKAELRKARRKRKRGGDGAEGKGREDRDPAVPGDFDVAPEASKAGGKHKRRRKRHQGRMRERGGEDGAEEEGGEETDREGAAQPRPDDGAARARASSPAPASALPRSRTDSATRLPPPIQPSLSFDTDSSWTHVDRRLGSTSASVSAVRVEMETSSDVGSTDPDADSERDVRARGGRAEGGNVPTLTRAQPRADESPAPGFSWEDYAEDSLLVHDADQEDEGEWGIVKSRSRARFPQTSSTMSQAPAAPETMTKKQRQNARKRELAKAAKAEAEATRLQGLAKHKRELERQRIIEQSQQGGGKQPSGGMHATVDDQGKLVWE